MNDLEGFSLDPADHVAFAGYFVLISLIGWLASRKRQRDAAGYFLGGRSLPWYVVGSSYIAANISSEQFIGMVGSACVYGICVATPEWSSVVAFTFLIWIFIPFLMAAKVFTAPEYLEARFNRGMRDSFAAVTILINVFIVLAGVVYGGALAMDTLFGLNEWAFLVGVQHATGLDPIWFSIVVIAIVAGGWAVYGGLKSVAWMDLLTITVMVVGGLSVTWFGLRALAGESGSMVEGFGTMIERNQATMGQWAEAASRHTPNMMFGATAETAYNRLSVIQPINHRFFPWLHWVFSFFYIGLWYTAINQFMVQRIFGARNQYHARMGIVLAGYLKLLLPFIVVVPGLILVALKPDILLGAWGDVQPEADRGYVTMLQSVVPVGVRGVFLAALFGAIQSTVSAVEADQRQGCIYGRAGRICLCLWPQALCGDSPGKAAVCTVGLRDRLSHPGALHLGFLRRCLYCCQHHDRTAAARTGHRRPDLQLAQHADPSGTRPPVVSKRRRALSQRRPHQRPCIGEPGWLVAL